MCKVSSVVKVTDKNRDLAWIFMQHLGQVMSLGNNDGLGYAAFDKAGRLFGERWLINKTAFTDLSFVKGINAQKMNHIYSFFGEKVLREQAQGIILHTRFATCGKGIQNTHPFVDNIDTPNTAIIHNGIIGNDLEFEKKFSTCDSEVLVHLYEKHKVYEKLKNINEFTPNLDGWYTVLNLTTTPEGRMVMDMYTDTGRLASYYLPDLDVVVYATDARDIEKTAKFFDLKLTNFKQYRPETAKRVDVLTGEVLEACEVKQPPKSLYWPSGQVVTATGNFDDANFLENWLKRE